METMLFHVFRNTPLGREIFLQSLYFCSRITASVAVYVPETTKFLMYFENDVVQVDLDSSYLTAPETAPDHARALADEAGVDMRVVAPKNYTASTLPDIPVNFDFMCCPRIISDLSSKISLGNIGPKARRIVNQARFPVLMPSSQFKAWKSITVFFGGSMNAVKSLRLGISLARSAGVPVDMFTQAEKRSRADLEEILKQRGLYRDVQNAVRNWQCCEGKFEHNLYDVPHDSLVVIGAFGHGLVRDVLFGSTMEKVQTVLPNTILIVGPNYVVPPI